MGPRNTTRQVALAALALWACLGVVFWILRDGLGPDSETSRGWTALSRLFWTFYWGPILILLATTVCVLRGGTADRTHKATE